LAGERPQRPAAVQCVDVGPVVSYGSFGRLAAAALPHAIALPFGRDHGRVMRVRVETVKKSIDAAEAR
jgi:hypothetical protein